MGRSDGDSMKRIFVIEADVIPQEDLVMILRYMRTRLNNQNEYLTIKSCEIKGNALNMEIATLIFQRDNR